MTAPAQRPEAIQAVQLFERACAEADHAQAREVEAAALPWYRWQRRRTLTAQATRDHAHAVSDVERSRRAFAWHGVGSLPGTWGVLSGASGLNLEDTLGRVSGPFGPDLAISSDAAELLRELPLVRLAAHEGDRRGESEVELTVRSLAARATDPKVRRRFIEHLPADARPLADSIADLDRRGHPITVSVTDDLSPTLEWRDGQAYEKQRIKLHDIITHDALAGLGLGSAALQELCRYADAVGLEIVGEMWPGPGFDDRETRLPRLAAWYTRHGFQVGSIGHAPKWRAASLVREPRSS